jgi:hypothetical protein
MPRLAFRATKSAFEVTDYALICGVADEGETYLTFQRAPEGMEEDDGVYIEYSDQINSGYQKIRRCTLARGQFSVDLVQPFRKLPDIDGFDVELDIKDADYAQLRVGLQRIFRGQLHVLTVVA